MYIVTNTLHICFIAVFRPTTDSVSTSVSVLILMSDSVNEPLVIWSLSLVNVNIKLDSLVNRSEATPLLRSLVVNELLRTERDWRFRCDAPDPAAHDGDVRGGLPEEGVSERGGGTVCAAGHVQRGDGPRHRPGPRRLPRGRGRSGTHESHTSNVSTALS